MVLFEKKEKNDVVTYVLVVTYVTLLEYDKYRLVSTLTHVP